MQTTMKVKAVQQYTTFLSLWMMGTMIISATYVTFLQEKGMNLFQVNLVNTCFFLTLFVCEIPTGAFADVFGRKKSFIIACLLHGLGSVIYGMSQTFWGFVAAEVCAAIGMTFMSGALKAWLVDSLVHHGYAVPDAQVFARAKLCSQIFGILACIGGAYLADLSPTLPWFVGGFLEFGVAILAIRIMTEEYFVHQKFHWKEGFLRMKNAIVSGVGYGINDKTVKFILVTTFIQIFSVQALNMYWQPFFGKLNVSKIHFGYIYFGMQFFLILGAFLLAKIRTDGKERAWILRSQIAVGIIVVFITACSGLPMTLALFLLHEVGRAFWEPMRDAYLHKSVPAHKRATVDSFCSVSPCIGGAIGLIVSGIIAQYGGILLSWFIAGLTLIIGGLLVARNGNHRSI